MVIRPLWRAGEFRWPWLPDGWHGCGSSSTRTRGQSLGDHQPVPVFGCHHCKAITGDAPRGGSPARPPARARASGAGNVRRRRAPTHSHGRQLLAQILQIRVLQGKPGEPLVHAERLPQQDGGVGKTAQPGVVAAEIVVEHR